MRGMETEFLDLIKTFEKTAKRLEILDTDDFKLQGCGRGVTPKFR